MINNSNFLINSKDIPTIPIEYSEESRLWWKKEYLRCIEGYSFGGKWMPPNLYFYVNYWNILLNIGKSKTKIAARPFLRDIEWEVFYAWVACRGLSEFITPKGDIINVGDTNEEVYYNLMDGINIPSGSTPLYKHQAKDLMILGSREFGKTYLVAGGIIAHEWLFNGRKGLADLGASSNILVGAGESTYSSNLLSKVMFGLDHLQQSGLSFANQYFPHPFFQNYNGTLLKPGSKLVAEYQKKVGGSWLTLGSKSTIQHVTYKNNDFAGQGTRNSVMVKEEVGMFENLERTFSHDKETMKNGNNKFGSCVYLGTGGDMEKGTIGAYKMFYSPEVYDLLCIKDRWENKGNIGLFIPGTKRSMEFKDENGITDEIRATESELQYREKLKKSKNSRRVLLEHIQYNPLVPSEVFLQSVTNIFPTAELQHHLAYLETNRISQDAEYIGELFYNEQGKVEYKNNSTLIPIKEYPITKDLNKHGALIIYDHPYEDADGDIPYGMYLMGFDPYAQDQSTTDSLGAVFVYNKVTNRIVAEFVGKPDTDKELFEIVRKLIKYYNAKCLYENQIKGFFDYMDRYNETHLLADQPAILKDIIQDSKVHRGKGCHMDDKIKEWGERLIRDWLLEPYDDIDKNILTLHKIRSIGLLKELIMYNNTGNFDRVIALIMIMILSAETKKILVEEKSQSKKIMEEHPFFSAITTREHLYKQYNTTN